MRLAHLQSSRPPWYDRNSVTYAFSGTALNAAPHGTTIRATYTVPANRKAMMEFTTNYIQRITAAAPNGTIAAFVTMLPATGGGIYAMQNFLVSNTALQIVTENSEQQAVMVTGDYFDISDYDDSTGGTATIATSVKITEFDAQ